MVRFNSPGIQIVEPIFRCLHVLSITLVLRYVASERRETSIPTSILRSAVLFQYGVPFQYTLHTEEMGKIKANLRF